MKIFERFTKKMAGKAGDAVKVEVKKTALDLLPKVLGMLAMGASIWLFKSAVLDDSPSEPKRRAGISNTTIMNNNYFFNDVSEDLIWKIVENQIEEDGRRK